jgi:hypothetical protein
VGTEQSLLGGGLGACSLPPRPADASAPQSPQSKAPCLTRICSGQRLAEAAYEPERLYSTACPSVKPAHRRTASGGKAPLPEPGHSAVPASAKARGVKDIKDTVRLRDHGLTYY